jgi:hypothetical protein
MKFEYRAEDQILAIRTGIVEADSAAQARTLLEQRNLTVLTLRPQTERRSRPASLPVENQSSPPPQRRTTDLPGQSSEKVVLRAEFLTQLDWRKIGRALVTLMVVLVALYGAFAVAFGPRDYTIVIEGQVRVLGQIPAEAARLAEGVRVKLWITQDSLVVNSDGSIWQPDASNQWQEVPGRTALYKNERQNQGRFRMEVRVRLPHRPQRVGIIVVNSELQTRRIRGILLNPELRGNAGDVLLVARATHR